MLVVVSLNLLDPVLDAMEKPQAQPMARLRREGVQVLNPHPECLAEITIEYPYLQDRYEQFRGEMDDAGIVDRRHVQLALFREAEKTYETNTGERMAHWQRRLLARYTRNLALVNQRADGAHLRPHGGGALGRGRQLRLGGLGNRQPLSASEDRDATS